MKIKTLMFCGLALTAGLLSQSAAAQSPASLGLGVKLLGSQWTGDNVDSDTTYKSSNGGQFGLNLVFQKGRFYTGFNFQGGDYKFKDDAPDQISKSDSQYSKVQLQKGEEVTIKRDEADLLVGYYFWPKISLFLDIKSISSVWDDKDKDTTNYGTNYVGLGLGVSGFIPLNQQWTLFGSFGLVPKGTIKQKNGDKAEIGSGSSGALEFGSIYNITNQHRINFGLKSQWQNYKFDNEQNDEQKHQLTSVFIGYNYVFFFGHH
jgi:hypothetical protein